MSALAEGLLSFSFELLAFSFHNDHIKSTQQEFDKECAQMFVQQEDYFLGKCFEAMEVDSLSSSHPVSTPVENPSQIQEMFDDVSYDKVHYKTSENFFFSFLFFKLFKSMLQL